MSAVKLDDTEQEILFEKLGQARRDIGFFAADFLGVKPRTWQKNAWAQISERWKAGKTRVRVNVRTCHGAGKTFFAAGTLLGFMVTRFDARGLTTAPTWSGVENLLWPEISKLYNRSIFKPMGFGRLLGTSIHFNRGTWFAVGASSDRPENLEGHHSRYAAIRVVDEAKAVEESVYEATEGLLNAPEMLDLWISTPSIETGKFYERDMSDDDVVRVVVTVDDLINDPEIPQQDRDAYAAWKEERAKEWGVESAEYKSRVLAQYIDNAEGALFPSSWIERAMSQTFEGSDTWERSIGMDVAGSVDGDQNAACVVAKSNDGRLELLALEAWHERDTMKSAGRVLDMKRAYKVADLRVDSTGIGKGVSDFTEASPYLAGSRPSDKDKDRFSNRKAEDCWSLRRSLEAGQVSMGRLPEKTKQALKAQMRAMKYEILQTSKLRVVDPDDSPDLSDAVVIAQARSRVGFTTTNVGGL